MKNISIEFDAVREGEEVSGSVTKQRKRNETWINEETIVHTSKDKRRVFLLDDNQRLVIEAGVNAKVVFDKEQFAASVQQRIAPRKLEEFHDGDEESPRLEAVERAEHGSEFMRLMELEKAAQARQRAIEEARKKVAEKQQPSKAPKAVEIVYPKKEAG